MKKTIMTKNDLTYCPHCIHSDMQPGRNSLWCKAHKNYCVVEKAKCKIYKDKEDKNV